MSQIEEPFVFHLDDGREWRGGQHQVALLAEGLAKRGVRQVVWTPEGSPLARRLSVSGIECRPLRFRGEWDWRASRTLATQVTAQGANLIHAHTAHAHALAVAVHRSVDSGRATWAGAILSTRRVDFPLRRSWFSRRKYLYPHQSYIAISKAVREELVLGGVSGDRITLVPSGVPPFDPARVWNRERVRIELGVPKDAYAIVNVGALTDHKGQRWMIEAASKVLERFPQVSFWILGEGELREELTGRIAALNLGKKVRLCGHVEDARHKLSGFDLYVSSSHLEGLGTANLDAMLAGLPIVAAAAGGVTDVIRDGEEGVLVSPRDAGSMGDGIIRMLNMDDSRRTAMIAAARTRIDQMFSAESMVEGNLAVYRSLLADSHL